MSRHMKGFTILELLIVMTIIMILVGVGTPQLSASINNRNVKNAAHEFALAVRWSRSEAIKRNRDISVKAINGNWTQGWEIVDNDETIQIHDPIEDLLIEGVDSILLSGNGRVSDPQDSVIFVLNHARDEDASPYCVSVSVSGRISIIEDTNHDGDCNNG